MHTAQLLQVTTEQDIPTTISNDDAKQLRNDEATNPLFNHSTHSNDSTTASLLDANGLTTVVYDYVTSQLQDGAWSTYNQRPLTEGSTQYQDTSTSHDSNTPPFDFGDSDHDYIEGAQHDITTNTTTFILENITTPPITAVSTIIVSPRLREACSYVPTWLGIGYDLYVRRTYKYIYYYCRAGYEARNAGNLSMAVCWPHYGWWPPIPPCQRKAATLALVHWRVYARH